jgi:hypothetical protein
MQTAGHGHVQILTVVQDGASDGSFRHHSGSWRQRGAEMRIMAFISEALPAPACG